MKNSEQQQTINAREQRAMQQAHLSVKITRPNGHAACLYSGVSLS